MDPAVLRGMARWPDVPAVYGWLALDRRGNWRLKEAVSGRFGRIGNAALRDFIGRNYASDGAGQWFFQNGPQRVYVSLAYTPLVVHYAGEQLFDHCTRPFTAREAFQDDEGAVLLVGERAVALLDDRDLARYADLAAQPLPVIPRADVAMRFGFVAEPEPRP